MFNKLLLVATVLVGLSASGPEIPFDPTNLNKLSGATPVVVVVTQMPYKQELQTTAMSVAMPFMCHGAEYSEVIGAAFKIDPANGVVSTFTVWPTQEAVDAFAKTSLHQTAKQYAQSQLPPGGFMVKIISTTAVACSKNMTDALVLLSDSTRTRQN